MKAWNQKFQQPYSVGLSNFVFQQSDIILRREFVISHIFLGTVFMEKLAQEMYSGLKF